MDVGKIRTNIEKLTGNEGHAAKLRTALQRIVRSYRFGDLNHGGRVVERYLREMKLSAERFPSPIREQTLAQLPEFTLGQVKGRGHLIKALVKHLGFVRAPQRVVEYFSGGNLTGALALPGTREYIQVSEDPFISGIATLPSKFFTEVDLAELTDPMLVKMLPLLGGGQRALIEGLMRTAVPNLKYFEEKIENFANRPAQANQADLCLVFFWATVPFREMEMVVKPGGYLVTIDIQREQLAAIEATVEHEVTKDAEAVRDSIYCEDLTDAFQKLLSETPGYRELKLSIVIMQKIKSMA